MTSLIALVTDADLRTRIDIIGQKLDIDEIVWQLDVKGSVARVAEMRPMVILMDLSDETTAWADIAWATKSNPATRRLGIIGFAHDIDDALRQKAASLLIDDVFAVQDVPRGPLLQTLEDRIKIYARRSDDALRAAVADAINLPMPSLVHEGLVAFNAGQFYDAHEYLEYAWVAETGPIRDLYRGILQISVAYYHIESQNYRGALKMFLRALQWLEPLPEVCQGINVAKLRDDSNKARQHMEALGPAKLDSFDRTLLLPVAYDEQFVPDPKE